MLACIKIGAIYTNIDIENPKIRLEKCSIFVNQNYLYVITNLQR